MLISGHGCCGLSYHSTNKHDDYVSSGGGVIVAVNKEYNSSHEEDLGKHNVEMGCHKLLAFPHDRAMCLI